MVNMENEILLTCKFQRNDKLEEKELSFNVLKTLGNTKY